MAKVRWTEESARSLQEIYDYILEKNPQAAQKVIEGIYKKVQLLKTFPKLGYKYKGEPEGEVRILLYGHYKIPYLVKYDVIEILGVFHGAVGIERYFNS